MNKGWLNKRMALYIFYYNYVRIKQYTVREKYEVIDYRTGEVTEKVRKFFERKTPAMHLGIFSRPVGFNYVLKTF